MEEGVKFSHRVRVIFSCWVKMKNNFFCYNMGKKMQGARYKLQIEDSSSAKAVTDQ